MHQGTKTWHMYIHDFMWCDHSFSQRNKTTEWAVGMGVGDNMEGGLGVGLVDKICKWGGLGTIGRVYKIGG